jgi:NADH:ubiquinone oxidoreductase subunit 3 (subunit A)
LFKEYFFLFYYLFGCFFLVIFLLCLSIFFVRQKPDLEKLSSYECGFNPYEDARLRFEIRFFLVGLLFIVFDLEVAYLLPWVIIFKTSLSFVGFSIMFIFLILLVFSFFFEWWQGALNWE